MESQPQPNPDLAQVLVENEALRQKLEKYKVLEEDLMAQRVFDKAQQRLKTWITIGGIAALITGIVGFRAIIDYSKALIAEQMKSVTREHIESVLLQEGKRQIGEVVETQRRELLAFSEQQKIQLSMAGSPVGGGGSSAAPLAPAAVTAESVDYTAQMLPVRDSGPEGAVVGFALAAALEYQIRKTTKETVQISPRFLYYYSREHGKLSLNSDTGAQIRDGIEVLKTRGAVGESAWPYRPGEFALPPPASVASARHYKISRTIALSGLAAIKSALATYGPVVVGITMYEKGLAPEVAKTGRLVMPAANEQPAGGHAVCLVGYDDRQKLFKFRNSWGANWGDKGYGYLPYAYVEQLSNDNWAFTL